jgi:hypothetical protein
MPSASSPTTASRSGTEAGATPSRATTPATSNQRSRSRSQLTTLSLTHWHRSLSGLAITTWVTRGSAAAIAAAVASASSASKSIIGHTAQPSAAATSSASPNCAHSVGSMPSPVL